MRNVLYGSILMLLAAGLVAVPARADMDQRCLSLCMNGGGNAPKCLPQCTYNEPQKSTEAAGSTVTSTHDVFVAPKPAGGEILLPAQAAKTGGPDKDYACLNQCLHEGGQYDRCSQSCTKTGCLTGGSGCKGLLGTTPAPSSGPAAP